MGGKVIRTSALLAAILGATCQCESKQDKDAQVQQAVTQALKQERVSQAQAREQEKASQAQALERERQELRDTPDSFLVTSNPEYYNKGIINDYRQLIKVSVLNRSKFPVGGLSGDVEWYDDDGGKFGSTTFALRGSIPSGDTKTFSTEDGSMTSTTIQGDAKKAKVKFAHVEIIDIGAN
jgi:hypothetical protein